MVNWDDGAKYRLLLAIIGSMDVKTPNWSAVAEKMGDKYSAEAVRQQFLKIRRNSEAELGSSDGTSAPATPRKRGSKAANGETPAKSATGKPRNARKGAADDDDEEESPTKKVKTEGRQAATGIKAEHGSEVEVDGEADRLYA